MGLSRLDNFLKSVRGTILYVDPNSIDATDSIENQGNSLTRPFRTIQRALIEASRFSYQSGLDNDRFNKTTIVLYPGDHVVDNRPGWIPIGPAQYRLRNGLTSNALPSFDLTTNFDLTTADNELYKLNSVHGGVIVPRGTSIVGMDLRKTVIRPLYVPNPENDDIERSALFRVTGGCYFWQFSVLDAPPNGTCYKDYNDNKFVPNFSHHKLTTFEYADGVNNVSIDDAFISNTTYNRTDLDMYYEKVGLVYGQGSGRNISPDYPEVGLDIQPKVDEYRIVGSRGAEVGISSIRAGNGVESSTTITVTLASELDGVDVDTPIRINGISASGYDGEYVVSDVVATGAQPVVEYQVSNPPANPLPSVSGSTFNISVDTVSSASPYIFNISLRSVYGMCGLHADGDKADGFKSMVVAQFTGIGLQKDDRAFVKYNTTTGLYEDYTVVENLHTDGLARYKPAYENYHIKTSNDSYIQVVSVFAIGYANHFLTESGGDQSITNSNSNFGARALVASGFRKNAFLRDDAGYISHILPPKAIDNPETTVEYDSIDVGVTTALGITSRLYLYGKTNQAVKPDGIVGGYRLGAKVGDTLNTVITSSSGISTEYSASIVMPNTTLTTSEKVSPVGRNAGINSISNSTITLSGAHALENGESIRIISETGHVPDGLDSNQVYFAITSGVDSDQIKVGQTLNDAIGLNPLTINNKGGTLKVVSRVSDKIPGDIGHPIQYDVSNSQWYVNVSSTNDIYSTLNQLGTTTIGDATPRTYIKRTPDTRNIDDTVYRLRYVIPSDSALAAKPPLEGFVIQNSNTSIGSTDSEVAYQFNPLGATLSNSTELRNPRIIADASWNSNTATIATELPHDLKVGSQVEILNVTSTNNSDGTANSGFNHTFDVVGISSAKEFSVTLNTDPGSFTNNTSNRTTSLPYFKNKQYSNSYYVYKSEEIQKYVPGEKDGIYHLLVVNTSNSPTVVPFTGEKFSQPIQNLYPQLNRDNVTSNPKSATSFALPTTIGQVVVDEPQNSITRETLEKALDDFGVGFALNEVKTIVGSGNTIHDLFSTIDHGLNPVTTVNIDNAGAGYGVGSGNTEYYYNARLVGYAGSVTGVNATARVTVTNTGTISNVKIMDGGSAYGIGNTMAVVGIATTTSHTPATVRVTNIIDNVGETISVNGVGSTTFEAYNTFYRIDNVSSPTKVRVYSPGAVTNGTTAGVGVTLTANATARLTGQTLDVSSISYTQSTGIATVTTVQNHGLQVGKSVLLSGADDSFYNKNFYVTQVANQTQFVINPGISGSSHSDAGTIYAHKTDFIANSGNTSKSDENLGGRFAPTYAGITTTISAVISDANATTIQISNVEDFNFQIGDFLMVDEEIMRIKSTVTGNPVSVFRGVLGTGKAGHSNGSVITKIAPRPVEFRRNSLLRASGHTFEYVGYGPGNYSTAFPDRQTRNLSPQEEFLGQATRKESGAVLYTGMNDKGDYYVGGKKVSGTTGEEEVFDIPIPTVTGEDPTSGSSVGFDRVSSSEVAVERSLRVEGGPDGDIVSEFDGPVVFNNKLTSTSTKGIEANSLFLQGDRSVSRKFTVGVSQPTLAGTPGDVVYNGTPATNSYTGWIYTTNSEWKPFGFLGGASPLVGFSSESSFIGVATNLDFRSGIGATIRTEYNATAGVGTVIVDASPLNVGVSTGLGLQKTFVGVATEINFVGYGVTISAVYNTSGIASVTFDATGGGTGSPGAPTNSVQFNNSGFFAGSSNFTFDGTDVFVGNSLGISNASPSAKLEIDADSTEALRINSTSGSGNIVRVDNQTSDTTPFIIDVNGNVGVNTVTAGTALDVRGDVSVGSTLRIYDQDHSHYIGLSIGDTTSDYTYVLPPQDGTADNALLTDGSGNLSWGYVSTEDVAAGAGITITKANNVATIANEGVTSITAGAGLTVTAASGDITISQTSASSGTLYPFTTRGFGYLL